MRNNIILLSLISLISFTTYTQGVKISTAVGAPDNSAMLEVESTDKGVLIPRVTLTATNSQSPITAIPANGLLVFNTTPNGAGLTQVYKGFYYWDAILNEWVQLVAGNGIVGTDDQNIDSIRLNGELLTVWVEDGGSQTIDLQPIIDSAIVNATDDQQIDSIRLNGDVLTTYIENGGSQSINLRPVIDSAIANTNDDQNIDSIRLNGDFLTTYIENGGSQSINLRPIIDSAIANTNDDQNIDSIRLNGDVLTTYIENGGSQSINLRPIIDSAIVNASDDQNIDSIRIANDSLTIYIENGLSAKTSLQEIYDSIEDHDWYKVGTTDSPKSINDSIYTMGRVGVGTNNPQYSLTSLNGVLGQSRKIGVGDNSERIVIGYDTGVINNVSESQIIEDGSTLNIASRSSLGSKIIFHTTSSSISATAEKRMIIDRNGNVGIGTTTPSELLELQGGGIQLNGTYGIGFNSDSTLNTNVIGDAAKMYYDNHFFGLNLDGLIIEKTDGNAVDPDGGIAFTNKGSDNIRETAMVIRGSGNVGIGTNNPSNIFTVEDTLRTTVTIREKDSVSPESYAELNLFNGNNSRAFIAKGAKNKVFYTGEGSPLVIGNFDSTDIALTTLNRSRLVIKGNGNVGIGTTTPDEELTVVTNQNNQTRIKIANGTNGTNSQSSLYLEGSHPSKYFNLSLFSQNNTVFDWADKVVLQTGSLVNKGILFTTQKQPFEFRTGSSVASSALYIDTNNHVGIGTVTPSERLEVNGDIKADTIKAIAFQSATTIYPDYVFEDYFDGESTINPCYKFKSLQEIESYINTNKHLPGVKSIEEVKTDKGYSINLGETSVKNLEKIEELYLHLIKVNNEKNEMEKSLNKRINDLEKKLELLIQEKK